MPVVPGLGTVPEVTAAPLLLLLDPAAGVPAQVGVSPLAVASASPRNPMTVVIQSPPLALPAPLLLLLLVLPLIVGVEE